MVDLIQHEVEQLIGRFSGPLNFRLVVMPTVVTILAIRAGLRAAREGQPPFIRAILWSPTHRGPLLRSAMRDIGRVFIVAVVMDTAYQVFVLKWFYPGQVLIVAVVCAIVPYLAVRGPVSLLGRWLQKRKQLAVDSKALKEI